MVNVSRRFYFFTINEKWFSYQNKFSDLLTLNANMNIRNYNLAKPFTIKKVFPTVENSLEKSEEEIFAAFSSSNRTKIRKAEREGVQCFFHKDIDGFIEFYNAFASAKNIEPVGRQRFLELGDNLMLSYAVWNDRILAAHSYLIDRENHIVRGGYSGSPRFDETVDASRAGRANKLLHYKDMLYLKERGIKYYNWGGYFEDTSDRVELGINEFKMSFGGEIIRYANYYSVSYFLFRKIAGLLGLLGKR